jgi:hypothetical protein
MDIVYIYDNNRLIAGYISSVHTRFSAVYIMDHITYIII